ncbi:MAG TPA: hypothetical protein PLU79_04320 [Burkholderiaceae bacterium]|nr:hypothetical protein [Burkholderiaceae bacterium]
MPLDGHDFGDVLRAMVRLGIHNDASIQRVAALMGVDLYAAQADVGLANPRGPSKPTKEVVNELTSRTASAQADRERAQEPQEAPGVGEKTSPAGGVADGREADSPTGRSDEPPLRIKVETSFVRVKIPHWLESLAAMPRGRPVDVRMPAPLFGHQRERASLAALASLRAESDDIDLEQVIGALCVGQTLTHWPMLSEWRMAVSVQLMLDESPGMTPYAKDLRQLAQAVRQLLPVDRVAVVHFNGNPNTNCESEDPDGFVGAWQAPDAGSVVLMATDLGIGRPDPFQWPMVAGEWLAFSHRVKDSACHLRTLVPYSASRWPHSLGAALAAQEWSPRSTAGHLRRTLQVLISHEAQQAHVVSQ